MNKYIIDAGGNTLLVRVYKPIAKKIYNHNLPVYFIPCNMRPLNQFFDSGSWIKKTSADNASFEQIDNSFTYYNCNRESGYYAAYYIPYCRVDRFSSKKTLFNTTDTAGTILTYDTEYIEKRGI